MGHMTKLIGLNSPLNNEDLQELNHCAIHRVTWCVQEVVRAVVVTIEE